MTQFENLELMYNQFFNLIDEIRVLIEKEEYASVAEKLVYKDQLVLKLANVKHTVECSNEELIKIQEFEQKIREKDNENIKLITNLREDLKKQLNITKKQIKVSSKYRSNAQAQTGVFCDLSE